MAYQPYSLGQFNLTTQILTDQQFAPLQLDVNGNLKVVSSSGNSIQGGPSGSSLYGLLLELLTEIKRTNLILISSLSNDSDVTDDFNDVDKQV